MWNVTVYSMGKKPEGHDERFSNINYPDCPVCKQGLDDWKVVRGYVKDEVIGHEFRVCLHKRCMDRFTTEHAFEVLAYDPEYGNISFDYQGEIAVDIRKQIANLY